MSAWRGGNGRLNVVTNEPQTDSQGGSGRFEFQSIRTHLSHEQSLQVLPWAVVESDGVGV